MIAMLLFRCLLRCSFFQIGNHGDKTICLFSWASTEDGKGFLFSSLEKAFNTKLMCHPLESYFLLYWLVIWKLNLCSHIQYQTTPNICFRYVLKPPNLRAAQIFAWFYLFILKNTSSLGIKNKIAYFFLFLLLVLKWDVIRWLRTWKHRNKYHKILHNCVCKL